jgi:hypothetical protein
LKVNRRGSGECIPPAAVYPSGDGSWGWRLPGEGESPLLMAAAAAPPAVARCWAPNDPAATATVTRTGVFTFTRKMRPAARPPRRGLRAAVGLHSTPRPAARPPCRGSRVAAGPHSTPSSPTAATSSRASGANRPSNPALPAKTSAIRYPCTCGDNPSGNDPGTKSATRTDHPDAVTFSRQRQCPLHPLQEAATPPDSNPSR